MRSRWGLYSAAQRRPCAPHGPHGHEITSATVLGRQHACVRRRAAAIALGGRLRAATGVTARPLCMTRPGPRGGRAQRNRAAPPGGLGGRLRRQRAGVARARSSQERHVRFRAPAPAGGAVSQQLRERRVRPCALRRTRLCAQQLTISQTVCECSTRSWTQSSCATAAHPPRARPLSPTQRRHRAAVGCCACDAALRTRAHLRSRRQDRPQSTPSRSRRRAANQRGAPQHLRACKQARPQPLAELLFASSSSPLPARTPTHRRPHSTPPRATWRLSASPSAPPPSATPPSACASVTRAR